MKKFVFVMRPDGAPLDILPSHKRADLARFLRNIGYHEHTDETLAVLRDLTYKETKEHNIVYANVTIAGREEPAALFYALPERTYFFLLRWWGGLKEYTPEALIARLEEEAPPGFVADERAA